MNAFEKLSSLDLEMIHHYIGYYGAYDGSGIETRAPLNHILRFWTANKEDLFNLFGGNVILTKTISVARPQPMIEDEISSMVLGWGQPGKTFYEAFNRWTNLMDEKYKLRHLLYIEALATNIYSEEGFSIPTPDGHKIDIPTGCKISKVLGKIAKAYNIEGYEDFRIAHSMCLNQKHLKGELCVSIHPLDYMTMSDNNCGWDSCMSWQAPGDYRLGTVEMMNSPCVVVAYLKASEDMDIGGGYEWNSKKWRQLFIVTPHIITGIRQYPYNSDELNAYVLKWLRELAHKNAGWGPYSENMSKVRNYNNNVFADLDCESRIEFYTHFMYNDFYAEHNSYVAASIPPEYKLKFSGETECVVCGEDITHYDDSMTDASCLTCNDCEHVWYCSECGQRMGENDEAITIDGYRICEYCYNEHYRSCSLCEETHHENDFYTVYLRDENREFTSYSIEVCSDCYNNETFKRMFGEARTVDYRRWDCRCVVDLENLTMEGLEYFEIWHGRDYEEYKAYIESKSNDET